MLAASLDAALGGDDSAETLATYHQRRDELSREVYETTQQIAALEWDDNSLLEIFLRFGTAAAAEMQAIQSFG